MLNSKQRRCIELLVAGCRSQKEIAREISAAESTICNWKKNDEFMAAYTEALKDSMKSVAALAFKTETALLKARSETVRLMAAKDILDRAGFKPKDQQEIEIGGGKDFVFNILPASNKNEA